MTFGPTLPTNLELLLQSNALERMVRAVGLLSPMPAAVGLGSLLAVVAGREASMRFGLERNCSVRRVISGGIVAENKSVWRFGGIRETILSISGINPISSIRSASSITRMRMSFNKTDPRSNRSIKRPGVAIKTSTPLSSSFVWSPIDSPPTRRAIESLWYLP
jgi:hypothetical protein